MNITTQRDLIRAVAKRWKDQYCRCGEWDKSPAVSFVTGKQFFKDKEKIGKQLSTIDLETATAEQVNEIIGNDAWTNLTCNECGQSVTALITVGQKPGWESATASLCRNCIAKAAAMEWPNE